MLPTQLRAVKLVVVNVKAALATAAFLWRVCSKLINFFAFQIHFDAESLFNVSACNLLALNVNKLAVEYYSLHTTSKLSRNEPSCCGVASVLTF